MIDNKTRLTEHSKDAHTTPTTFPLDNGDVTAEAKDVRAQVTNLTIVMWAGIATRLHTRCGCYI